MTDFNLFWESYPVQLCNRKGSKKKALEIWEKIPESEYGKILTNMRELARADMKCKQMGGKRSDWIWPMVTTWLNGERWADITDLKQSADLEKLSQSCKCGKPVDFGPTKQCWGCYEKDHKPNLSANREALRKIGFTMQDGESRADYNARCRAYCQQKGNLAKTIAAKQAIL